MSQPSLPWEAHPTSAPDSTRWQIQGHCGPRDGANRERLCPRLRLHVTRKPSPLYRGHPGPYRTARCLQSGLPRRGNGRPRPARGVRLSLSHTCCRCGGHSGALPGTRRSDARPAPGAAPSGSAVTAHTRPRSTQVCQPLKVLCVQSTHPTWETEMSHVLYAFYV